MMRFRPRWFRILLAAALLVAAGLVVVSARHDQDSGMEIFGATVLLLSAWVVLWPRAFWPPRS